MSTSTGSPSDPGPLHGQQGGYGWQAQTASGAAPPYAGASYPGQPHPPAAASPGYGTPGYGTPGYGSTGIVAGEPAGMGRRLGARLLDGLILGVLLAVPLAVAIPAMVRSADPVTGEPTDAQSAVVLGIVFGFQALVFLYEVVLIALRGQTLGKMAVGIRVVRRDTGTAPGWGSSLLRWAIPFVGSFACGIGNLLVYLSPLFDGSGSRQGWHDKVAGTLVVATR